MINDARIISYNKGTNINQLMQRLKNKARRSASSAGDIVIIKIKSELAVKHRNETLTRAITVQS